MCNPPFVAISTRDQVEHVLSEHLVLGQCSKCDVLLDTLALDKHIKANCDTKKVMP